MYIGLDSTLYASLAKNNIGINTARIDEVMNNLPITNITYDTYGNISSVKYSGDNGSTNYIRSVMVYTISGASETLNAVQYFYNTNQLVTPNITLNLTYDGNGNIISTLYS